MPKVLRIPGWELRLRAAWYVNVSPMITVGVIAIAVCGIVALFVPASRVYATLVFGAAVFGAAVGAGILQAAHFLWKVRKKTEPDDTDEVPPTASCSGS